MAQAKKKMSDSHINKRIKMLEAEAAEGHELADKAKVRALIMLVAWIAAIILYQVAINFEWVTMEQRLGGFDIIVLGVLTVAAILGTRFWSRYSRGKKQYKRAESYLERYRQIKEDK